MSPSAKALIAGTRNQSATSRGVIMLLCLHLLAGCSSLQQQELAGNQWQFIGKLSLQTEAQTRVLGIDWTQSGDRTEIDLSGPFGVRVANITAQNGELIVDTGKSVTRYDNGAVLNSAEFEGLKLPWETLSWWVRGQTGARGQMIESDGISRGNWHFRVTESSEEGPKTMVLEHPDVKLRLKVRKWLFSLPEKPVQSI